MEQELGLQDGMDQEPGLQGDMDQEPGLQDGLEQDTANDDDYMVTCLYICIWVHVCRCILVPSMCRISG